MRFSDLVLTALTNLYRRKARTLLTILGVIIGTMSIVLMVALGEGSKQVFMEQVSQNVDLTKIELYMGYTSQPSNSKESYNEDTIREFEQMEHVRSVMPVAGVSVYISNSRYGADMYLQAVPFDRLELLSEKLEWGEIKKDPRRVNVVLGYYQSQNFMQLKGNKELWECPVAENIDLTREEFDVAFGGYYMYTEDAQQWMPEDVTIPPAMEGAVTGVFAESGSELDYMGYIDIDYLKQLLKNEPEFCEYIGVSGNYESISIYADDMNNVKGLLDQLKEMGYNAYSPMEYIEQMQEESARQQAQWGMVGAIALLVSAIGIINTMLTSIMERKREIGVLKVLGCPLPSISAMFLIEAAVIGMLGGAIGVGLSYLVSVLVRVLPIAAEGGQFLGSFFGENVRFVITLPVGVGAIAGAALIGMIAGIYPSLRAMRMSALAALRDE